MVMTAPPRPEIEAIIGWYTQLPEKARIWLLGNQTLRIFRNGMDGSTTFEDRKVLNAEIGPGLRTARFWFNDGTVLDITRSDDCCGWGQIAYVGPIPDTTRVSIRWLRFADVPWLTMT